MPYRYLLILAALAIGFFIGAIPSAKHTVDAKTEKVLTSEKVEILCAEGFKFARFKTDGNLVQIMKSDGYPMECTDK